jgi:spore coat polysaccharide biosynthesis protein SpsF
MKVLAVIQARMRSSRLPAKVMLDIAGKPMLQRVIERTSRASLVGQVVVATTDSTDEDPIAVLCGQLGVDCYRGSLQDVLDRYYRCAQPYQPDVVVRITSDCPVIDPGLIDETIRALTGRLAHNELWQPQGEPGNYRPATQPGIPWDFAATRLPPPWHRTFPIGLDVEACTFAALETAWREAKAQHEREHVMPYLYQVPGQFRCIIGNCAEDLGSQRWTVDTAADLEMIRGVYTHLSTENFTWLDVLKVVRAYPELSAINADVHHKTYLDVDTRK